MIMNFEKEKRKRKSILLFSLLLHALVISLLAFPFLKTEESTDLLYSGFLVRFDSPNANSPIKSKKGSIQSPNSSTNKQKPKSKKEAETNSDLLKPTQSRLQKKKTLLPKGSDSEPKKVDKVISKTNSEEATNIETEKRRQFLLNELAKSVQEKQRQENEAKNQQILEQNARKAKYEKTRNAFSQILENAHHETATTRHIDLSAETSFGREIENSSLGENSEENFSNRYVIYQPDIKDQSYKQGRVVINICVNAAGDVISSRFTQKGSTTTDQYLQDLAEKMLVFINFQKVRLLSSVA